MENDIQTKIAELEKKVDAVYESVEKMRKYMMWTGLVTLGLIVLPLIALAFIIPSLIDTYTTALSSF